MTDNTPPKPDLTAAIEILEAFAPSWRAISSVSEYCGMARAIQVLKEAQSNATPKTGEGK